MSETLQYALLGGMLTVVLALFVLHWRLVLSHMSAMEGRMDEVRRGLERLKSMPAPETDLRISIVSPSDHKTSKPVRSHGEEYVVSPITGVASGKVGSAYLAIRQTPSGEPRLVCRLDIVEGYWSGAVKVRKWEKAENFEAFAVAFQEVTNFPLNGRVVVPPQAMISNRIPIRVLLKSKD